MFLGKNLKIIRKKWGMKQEEFSKIFGVTRAMISSYESEVAEPKIRFLLKLYELTSVTIYNLCTAQLRLEDIPVKPYQSLLEHPPSPLTAEEPLVVYQKKDELYDYRNLVTTLAKLEEQLEGMEERLEKLEGE